MATSQSAFLVPCIGILAVDELPMVSHTGCTLLLLLLLPLLLLQASRRPANTPDHCRRIWE
jgi:hypothetical protein